MDEPLSAAGELSISRGSQYYHRPIRFRDPKSRSAPSGGHSAKFLPARIRGSRISIFVLHFVHGCDTLDCNVEISFGPWSGCAAGRSSVQPEAFAGGDGYCFANGGSRTSPRKWGTGPATGVGTGPTLSFSTTPGLCA